MTTIALTPDSFPDAPAVLAQDGALSVAAFRYASGVAALDLRTDRVRLIVLPFRGQQIWDAEVGGRRLTMQSRVADPLETDDFVATYGAFHLHCGGTAMGNPQPDDDHPLHGELPLCRYAAAEVTLAEGRIFVTSRGEVQGPGAIRFAAAPTLAVATGSDLIEIGMAVQNVGPVEMPFFYLGHANFRPLDGARVVDGDPDARAAIRPPVTRADATAAERAWHAAVAADPDRHRDIRAGDRTEPEFVATLHPAPGPDGWVATRQVHPDGRCDVVWHRPAELPVLVRWMARTPDRQALGFCLPATAAPDGRAAGLRRGQAIMLPPGARWQAAFRCGAEDAVRR